MTTWEGTATVSIASDWRIWVELPHDCKPEPYVPIVRGERFDYAAISPTFWRCYLCREPMYGVPK